MKQESQITEADYRKFFKEYHLWNNTSFKVLLGVFIVALFTLSIYNKSYSWIAIIATFLIVTFVMFAILFAIPYTVEVMRLELSGSKKVFDGYFINATNEGIMVTEGDQKIVYKLSNIKRSHLTKNYLGVRLYNKAPGMKSGLLLMHRQDFYSEGEISQFFYHMRKPVYSTTPLIYQNKIPYAWGILSIIPFIGGINGIIMVIQGIFKFKSTVYVILGAIGIFFTGIILMFYLIAPDTNSSAFDSGIKQTSQNEMNDLVKNIEFYKLQHNQYPDSLQQLVDEDKTIGIYDPIYSFKKKEGDHPFYYKKIDNKYTLFSSGIDMIPHTADDIYPTVRINDTSKIGLIKADNLKAHSN